MSGPGPELPCGALVASRDPERGRAAEELDLIVTQARMDTEQERTAPPYMSVGLPIIPARPGAEQTSLHRSEIIGDRFDVLAGLVSIAFVGQGKVDERPEVTLEIAHVVPTLLGM
jgi:hypothetical protein